MNKIKRRFLNVVFALMISLPISAVSAYAEGGTIYDFTTASAVMGVWIEVKDGDSGWANFSQSSTGVYYWDYNAKGKEWRAHIGLGHNKKWLKTVYSDWVTGNADISMYWDYRNPHVDTSPF